jgi:hypothetical protein
LVAAAAGLVALAFSSTAFAAYDPSLLVAGTNHALGGSGSVVIGFGQDENDDATAVATIYSPPGYSVTLTQPAGTTLGSLSGVVKVGAPGGARVNVAGEVKTDNPANHVSNPCSPGAHEAVWVLEFTLSGTLTRVPLYVDRVTTAPESAFASARIRTCFPSPYIPPPQGATSGASLIVAAFAIRGVFTNPGTRGSYPWNGVFVPYTPGTGMLNAANSAQSTSFVRLPMRVTMTAKRQRIRRTKRTFAVVTACVTEAGQGIRSIAVQFRGAATTAAANRLNAPRLATGRTNARGCVTRRIHVKRSSLFVRVIADVPARQAPGCQPTIVPRCTEASVAPGFDPSSGRAKRVRR